MCLTIPAQIKSVSGNHAVLANGNQVNVALIKNAKEGDWVLVNADLAISKITAKEAQEIKNYFK